MIIEFLYELSAVLGVVLVLLALGLLMIPDDNDDLGFAALAAAVGVVMIFIGSQGL